MCDAPDSRMMDLIAEGDVPGLRIKKVDGEEVVDVYARINPERYRPEGTLVNPTPTEIKDFHETGT